jgi:HNH endonuclease
MTWMDVVRLVEARAKQRCEYCRMHQSLQVATFHIEHIIPTSRGGSDDPDNLALACPSCNLHKSDHTEVADPDSNAAVPLFNPRKDRWTEHFQWEGYRIIGVTVIGRATVFALHLNHSRRLLVRQAEEGFGLFPPSDGSG